MDAPDSPLEPLERARELGAEHGRVALGDWTSAGALGEPPTPKLEASDGYLLSRSLRRELVRYGEAELTELTAHYCHGFNEAVADGIHTSELRGADDPPK